MLMRHQALDADATLFTNSAEVEYARFEHLDQDGTGGIQQVSGFSKTNRPMLSPGRVSPDRFKFSMFWLPPRGPLAMKLKGILSFPQFSQNPSPHAK